MRKWTFMVYMAGDNGKIFDDGGRLMGNLEAAGWHDLAEMSSVGSNSDVAIVAQYDTLTERQHTPRFFIDGASRTGQLIEKLPSVNTGDPKNLTDFIIWAERNYPAKRYALVLWNHGSGWKEDDIYVRYREHVERAINCGDVRAGSSGERLLRHSMFLTTAGEIMSIADDQSRGICYDDSSMDFLDGHDLVNALSEAEGQTKQRIALLGMDACFMSMLEVAYQLCEHADVLVASQEVEPAAGWPYDAVLKHLAARPNMSTQELGEVIVHEYGHSFLNETRSFDGVTQSAIDLSKIPELGRIIGQIGSILSRALDQDPLAENAVNYARRKAQRFHDPDYIDLHDFLSRFGQKHNLDPELGAMITKIIGSLEPDSPDRTVIANTAGLDRSGAHGISIYLPDNGCSAYYDRMEFAELGWRDFIRRANLL